MIPRPSGRRGWLPALSLVVAGGLLTISVADTAARSGNDWAHGLFWIGILVLFVPPAARIAMPRTARSERIGCVLLIGLGLYLVKVLQSPVQFTFGDEFQHWRTAADILATGRLFNPNPLSIVSPFYPGLALVTSALVTQSGLSIYGAGLIIIGVARLIGTLALFLIVERVTRSSRVAAIASVLYVANPNFVFYSAQYGYESLSIPLAMLVIYLAIRRARRPDSRRAFDVALLLVIFALTATHHLTSYGLLAFLAAWSAISLLMRGRTSALDLAAPYAVTVLSFVAVAAWLFIVAPITFQYLDPVVGGAFHNVLQVSTGQRPIKTFFQGNPALVSPPWERAVAFAAVGTIAVLLGASLLAIARRARKWARHRVSALAYTFALASVLYFPLQGLRAIQGSTEISNRSGEFLFLPISLVVAVAIGYLWLARRSSPVRLAAFTAVATLVFMGGVIIGMPLWARLPGPYLVSGDTRAIQDESLVASDWMRRTFGVGNKLIADETNQLLMATYGGQDPVHGLSWIYFSPHMGDAEMKALTEASVRFLVVDRRVTTMLPATGFYYEGKEPDAGHHATPMDPLRLDKFDAVPDLVRVFDSGNIVIYELRPPAPKLVPAPLGQLLDGRT